MLNRLDFLLSFFRPLLMLSANFKMNWFVDFHDILNIYSYLEWFFFLRFMFLLSLRIRFVWVRFKAIEYSLFLHRRLNVQMVPFFSLPPSSQLCLWLFVHQPHFVIKLNLYEKKENIHRIIFGRALMCACAQVIKIVYVFSTLFDTFLLSLCSLFIFCDSFSGIPSFYGCFNKESTKYKILNKKHQTIKYPNVKICSFIWISENMHVEMVFNGRFFFKCLKGFRAFFISSPQFLFSLGLRFKTWTIRFGYTHSTIFLSKLFHFIRNASPFNIHFRLVWLQFTRKIRNFSFSAILRWFYMRFLFHDGGTLNNK